jgi:hypothetical protein
LKNHQRRATLTLGAVAGGLLGAALLPMAVAFANTYDFTPDLTSFAPTQVEGYPPLIDEVTGTENWGLFDATTNTSFAPDVIRGTDTETTIGSFTNDDYLSSSGVNVIGISTVFEVPSGTQIDLANFGLGFENEWLDITSGSNPGISDLFITPFGDFELFGTGFAELATAAA